MKGFTTWFDFTRQPLQFAIEIINQTNLGITEPSLWRRSRMNFRYVSAFGSPVTDTWLLLHSMPNKKRRRAVIGLRGRRVSVGQCDGTVTRSRQIDCITRWTLRGLPTFRNNINTQTRVLTLPGFTTPSGID